MPGRVRRHELDDIDRALVAALRHDGRAANVDLATAVGVSEKTVRNRIARLVAEHGLTVTAELAGARPGSRMVFLVHTDPGTRFRVADAVAALPETEQVHLSTGSADVVIVAAFDDDAAALRFRAQELQRRPGVREVASCHLMGEVGGPDRPVGPPGPRVDLTRLAELMIGPYAYGDLAELAGTICDAATAGLGADRALIATGPPGAEVDTSPIAGTRGISQRYLDGVLGRIADGSADGVIKRVWSTRLHLLMSDARTDPLMAATHDLVRAEGYVAMLTLPVLHGDSLVATISMYYDRPVTCDDAYIARAQGVADHFAVALARTLGLAPVAHLVTPDGG